MLFFLVVMDEINEVVLENIIWYMFFRLARERGHERKTTNLMVAMGVGLHDILFETVNPSLIQHT